MRFSALLVAVLVLSSLHVFCRADDASAGAAASTAAAAQQEGDSYEAEAPEGEPAYSPAAEKPSGDYYPKDEPPCPTAEPADDVKQGVGTTVPTDFWQHSPAHQHRLKPLLQLIQHRTIL